MQSYLSLFKNPAWDVVFFLMLIAGSFFWGISSGKRRMSLGVLGVYALFAVFPYVPLDNLLKDRAPNEIWMFKGAVFLGLLAVFSLFLSRSFKGLPKDEGSWWEIFILSLLYAGFLSVALIMLAPKDLIGGGGIGLSPLILQLFASPFSYWWLILPIFGIIFL